LLAANAPSLGSARACCRWGADSSAGRHCAQQKKFAIEGIAERKAARFREAGDGVEKELLALSVYCSFHVTPPSVVL